MKIQEIEISTKGYNIQLSKDELLCLSLLLNSSDVFSSDARNVKWKLIHLIDGILEEED